MEQRTETVRSSWLGEIFGWLNVKWYGMTVGPVFHISTTQDQMPNPSLKAQILWSLPIFSYLKLFPALSGGWYCRVISITCVAGSPDTRDIGANHFAMFCSQVGDKDPRNSASPSFTSLLISRCARDKQRWFLSPSPVHEALNSLSQKHVYRFDSLKISDTASNVA
jgi:hypothetical protein